MAWVRLTIYIEDIDDVCEDYDFIDIWRAETRYGTYTQLTNRNTRLRICADTHYYDYDDENGSEFYWYKWRYTTSNGPISEFFEPVQAYTPYIIYCGFEDVRRILRAKKYEGRIRFSDSYRNLRKGDDTQDISLVALSISPKYSGTEEYTITFTSATDFKVEVGEEAAIAKRQIGTGNISSDFTSDDNVIRINSDDWSGTPVADDTIIFETDSHMSIQDALFFIRDAETLVDVILEENLGYTTAKDDERRFDRDSVPKAVRASTARFGAFLIYTTIYQEQTIAGLPGNLNDITNVTNMRGDDISTVSKQAMRYLQGYINKYKEFFDPESGDALTTAPKWLKIEPMFDAMGVAGVGEGVKLPSMDTFFDRANMSYAGLLDWDLLGLSKLEVEMSDNYSND